MVDARARAFSQSRLYMEGFLVRSIQTHCLTVDRTRQFFLTQIINDEEVKNSAVSDGDFSVLDVCNYLNSKYDDFVQGKSAKTASAFLRMFTSDKAIMVKALRAFCPSWIASDYLLT